MQCCWLRTPTLHSAIFCQCSAHLHCIQQYVCQCRRQLAEKEEALAAAADKLADIDQHMHSLAAKYDKTLARLAEDRRAVATEEAERDAEEIAVQSTREQAVATEAAAKQQQALLEEQVCSTSWMHNKICHMQAFVCQHLNAQLQVTNLI